jgi:hypothetical protein
VGSLRLHLEPPDRLLAEYGLTGDCLPRCIGGELGVGLENENHRFGWLQGLRK